MLPAIAAAAPPPHDDFANATVIAASPTTIATTNVEATQESGEPEHGDGSDWGQNSIWYRWTATFTGTAIADTRGTAMDTMMSAYSGATLGTLTKLRGNDDFISGSVASRVSFPVTSGVTYHIAIDGYQGATGAITFRLNRAWNDAFAEPIVLSTTINRRGAYDNLFATKEGGEPSHAGNAGGASVWFTFTPTTNGTYWFDTLGLDTDIDTLLAVYTGAAVGSLSLVASNDDWAAGETRSRVTFAGVAGTTYRIAVDGKGGAIGEFNLRYGQPPPSNDDFANAVTLVGATASTTGSSVFATKQVGEPVIFGGEASIWYQWTAPANGGVVVDTIGSDYDVTLGVYTGAAVNALTAITTKDDHCNDLDSRTGFVATAGTTYRFMVDGTSGTWGNVAIRVRQMQPPNDMFASPTNLVGASVTSTCDWNYGATQEAGEPEHGECVCDSGDSSVWYTWTATATGTAVFTTHDHVNDETDFDTMIGVYTGIAVNALTILGRNDDHALGDARVEVPVVSGTQYRIAVDGFQTARGNFYVNINPPPPNGTVRDGTVAGTDADWTTSTTSLSATWDAPSQEPVTGYDWCLVSGSPSSTCAAPISSGSTASLAVTQAGTYVDGTSYFFCVRSKTAFVTATEYECSDGIEVDVSAPTTAGVRDSLGADVDTVASTTTARANWDAVTDPGVGLDHYEYCISTLTTCSGTVIANWTSTGTTTNVTRAGLSLANGTTYYVCVRTHDQLANISPLGCSDGVTVTVAGPTVTTIAPASGPQGRQDLTITITGTGFVSGATVSVQGADVSVQSRTWVSATQMTAVLDITSGGTPSARDVTVTNPDTSAGVKPGGFTVTAAAITVSLSVLGYDAAARDATAPYDLAFGTSLPGVPREIGPAGSGQRIAGSAVDVTITSDTDVTLAHHFAGWTGPAVVPAGSFTWRRNGTANPWVAMPTSATVERSFTPPVSGTYGYDYRVSLPASQAPGSYSTTVTYTVVAAA